VKQQQIQRRIKHRQQHGPATQATRHPVPSPATNQPGVASCKLPVLDVLQGCAGHVQAEPSGGPAWLSQSACHNMTKCMSSPLLVTEAEANPQASCCVGDICSSTTCRFGGGCRTTACMNETAHGAVAGNGSPVLHQEERQQQQQQQQQHCTAATAPAGQHVDQCWQPESATIVGVTLPN